MRCINCSGQFVTITGDLELSDKILGDFTVLNTEYKQCNDCGEKLYSPVTLKAIENTEELRKEELLLKEPIGEFIPAIKVAKILNCSRQAVHKHKRIRRGFIHFVKRNDTYQYHKLSVELFKATGDGRFQLSKPKTKLESGIISFSDYLEKRRKNSSEECLEDAGSDTPCKDVTKFKDSMEG